MNRKLFLNRYFLYLALSFLTVPIVIFIFKSIHPKNLAAIFAGGTFLSLSLFVILSEFKNNKKKIIFSLSFWGAFAFMLVFSLPMLFTRIMNYDMAFENLEILSMPAPIFHKASNTGFLIMMFLFFLNWILEFKNKKALLNQ